MATPGGFINAQLFHELKQQYPEIPDGVVTDFMIQHSNNKSKCLEVLAVESPKHMFGEYTSSSPVSQQMADLALMESSRQRSDSGSSQKSNASTGSLPSQGSGHVASLAMAWPPPQSQNNNGQGSGAASYTDRRTPPCSAPPTSTDFAPYLKHGKSSGQIPHIQCNTNLPDTVSSAPVVSSHHYSSPPQVRSKVWPQNTQSAASPIPNPSQVYNVSANVMHINSNNVPVATGQYDVDTAVTTGAVPNSTVPLPQHFSKATIYIGQRGEDARFVNPSSMPKVAVQPQLNIQQPLNVQQSGGHPQGSRIPVQHYVSNQDHHASPATSSPMRGVTAPPAPHFISYAASHRLPQQLRVSVSPVSSPTLDFSTASDPPSLVYVPSYNPPDLPGRGDIMPSANVPTVNYPRQTKLDMPNYQTLTRTLQQTAKSGSPVREAMTGSPVAQFPMYPVSLHSRVTAGSSPVGVQALQQPGRRSSQQEEMEYIQALISHQQLQKEKLASELERESKKLEQIRSQVSQLEKNTADTSDAYPTPETLVKLRDSNRKLLTEIQCMTREIDMFNKGKTPLGITNTGQEDRFYSHLDQDPGAAMGNVGVGPKPSQPHGALPHGAHPGYHTPIRPPFNPVHPHYTKPQPPPRPPKQPTVHPPLPKISREVPPAPPPQPLSTSGDSEEGDQWGCSACTFLNHPALNKCECCEMPRFNLGSR